MLVSLQDIKQKIFGMNDNKAPGHDSFSVKFFKKALKIVGKDVGNAIQFFFSSRFLLCEVNCTILALIQKSDNPSRANDFRLISCCNVIYKCISKILANRFKSILLVFINKAQMPFIEGRRIGITFFYVLN